MDFVFEDEKKKLPVKFVYTNDRPGYIGYYLKADDTERWVSTKEAKKFNKYNYFYDAVKEKSKAALFALKHKIMLRTLRKQDDYRGKLNWIGSVSWYDEDNFFYVTNFPGFENTGKGIAFQIRISDHPLMPNTYKNSHISYSGGTGSPQNAQFCLNLIIGKHSDRDPENTPIQQIYNDKEGIFVINCEFFEEKKSISQLQRITEFFNSLANGETPTISYQELYDLFGKNGNWSMKKYGQEFDPINFTKRKSLPPRGIPMNFEKEDYITKIKLSDILNDYLPDARNVSINGKTYYEFDDNGFTYIFDDDNYKLYRLKSTKNGSKIYKPNYLIPVEINLNESIKITEDDLIWIVNECVEQIKKRLTE